MGRGGGLSGPIKGPFNPDKGLKICADNVNRECRDTPFPEVSHYWRSSAVGMRFGGQKKVMVCFWNPML
jgi:hypothetical protein